MKDILTGLSLLFVIPSCFYFWYYFIYLCKTKQIKLPEDKLFRKKFHFFILLFLLGFIFVPRETYALTDLTDIHWTAYKQRSNDFRRPNNIHGYDPALSDCNGLGRWQGCPIPGVDSNLFQYYAITNTDFCVNTNVQANHVYSIKLYFWGGTSIKTSDANWSVGHNRDVWSSNGAMSLSSYEQGFDNGYRGTYTLTFVPNGNMGSFCFGLGSYNYSDRVVALNANYDTQDILLAYATMEELNTNDNSQVVSQQIETNNKLDETNRKINETNNKLDETNNKLDSIGDDLVDETSPSNSDYNSFMGDLPVLSFGPISQALQIPIQVLNKSISSFNYGCSNINFGSLLGTNLTIPCFSPMDYFNKNTTYGNLYNFIGIVSSIFIYYQIIMLVISSWEKWTSFDDGFNSLYSPKHADTGYKPKHGGGN